MSAVSLRVDFRQLDYVEAVLTAAALWEGRWLRATVLAAMALELDLGALPAELDALDESICVAIGDVRRSTVIAVTK